MPPCRRMYITQVPQYSGPPRDELDWKKKIFLPSFFDWAFQRWMKRIHNMIAYMMSFDVLVHHQKNISNKHLHFCNFNLIGFYKVKGWFVFVQVTKSASAVLTKREDIHLMIICEQKMLRSCLDKKKKYNSKY